MYFATWYLRILDLFFFIFSLSLSLHANPRHRLWTKLFVKVRRVFFNNTWPTLSLNALFHLGTLERAKASLMSLHPRKLVFNASARPTGSMNFSLEEGTLKVSVPFSTDSGSPMPPPPPRSLASLVFSSSCNWCSRRVRKVNRHFFVFFFLFFKKNYFSENSWSFWFLKCIFNVYIIRVLIFEWNKQF